MALSAQDWDVVTRAPLFKAMGPTITRTMIGDRAPRVYARGETIFEQGQPADGFFCVVDGWAKLYRLREDGEEVFVAVFAPGETFAEVAMFLGGRYPANSEAVSQARILKIDAANLRRAVRAEPQLAFDLLAASSTRLRQLVDEIERLEARSAPQRVADFFVNLANAASGPARLARPYEKALIANRLGMKPENFSRALGKLAELGVVVRARLGVDRRRRAARSVRGRLGRDEFKPNRSRPAFAHRVSWATAAQGRLDSRGYGGGRSGRARVRRPSLTAAGRETYRDRRHGRCGAAHRRRLRRNHAEFAFAATIAQNSSCNIGGGECALGGRGGASELQVFIGHRGRIGESVDRSLDDAGNSRVPASDRCELIS